MKYCVYVLWSEKFRKIYIGCTSNLESRFESHNAFSKKGWTSKFRPWTIIYQEGYNTKSDAIRRERELKSAKGRNFIHNNLIKKDSVELISASWRT